MPREIVHVWRKIKVAIDTDVGTDGSPVRRDVILHPGAVVILPVLDAGNVVLLRNHRHAVGETLWEIPAGALEPNEPPETAARRELAEETGYEAGRWTYWGYLYASPGVLDEKLHLYFAEQLTAGVARPEADEELEPVTVPFADAVKMALSGEIKDAKTVTALLVWERLTAAGGKV